jgi:transposase
MFENSDEENLSELSCQDDFVDPDSEQNPVTKDIINKLKKGEQKASQEILDRLLEGRSAKEIADCFRVTENVVTSKIRSIRTKGAADFKVTKTVVTSKIHSIRAKATDLLSLPESKKAPEKKSKIAKVLEEKITDTERKLVRKWWFARGGIIDWNDVKDFHKSHIKRNVSIHQVTGVIGPMHKELAKGKIHVRDLRAYNANRAERGQTTCCKYVGKCQHCGLCKVPGTLYTRERAAK